ncbi:GIY-YIG nuclease family protein [Parafrankia sp. BMG5.11]|uniref:GIY-YIG nuclease family protein n=1 Tax=Parafrankia sp. BMG5.11 TaxID=222540 RepID=UPI0014053359|nr:GIY-YIG nuclease family protein [Parafrankia sp. BMG5.11]
MTWEAAQRRRTIYDAKHGEAKANDPPPLVRAWRSIVAKHGSLPGGKAGYIYVIKFDTGAVKVGRTSRPSRRVSEHDRACRPFGVEIEEVWISQPHEGYANSERMLIAACSKIAEQIRKEYFRGVDFMVAVDIARTLDGNPL